MTAAKFNGSRFPQGRGWGKGVLPCWRGRELDGPPFKLSEIEEIGLLIKDKKPGPFALEVHWIKLDSAKSRIASHGGWG